MTVVVVAVLQKHKQSSSIYIFLAQEQAGCPNYLFLFSRILSSGSAGTFSTLARMTSKISIDTVFIIFAHHTCKDLCEHVRDFDYLVPCGASTTTVEDRGVVTCTVDGTCKWWMGARTENFRPIGNGQAVSATCLTPRSHHADLPDACSHSTLGSWLHPLVTGLDHIHSQKHAAVYVLACAK